MGDSKQEAGESRPNQLSIQARGRLVLCDVVFHQDIRSKDNVFPNLILLVKIEDAQVLGSDATLPGGTSPDGQIVVVNLKLEW